MLIRLAERLAKMYTDWNYTDGPIRIPTPSLCILAEQFHVKVDSRHAEEEKSEAMKMSMQIKHQAEDHGAFDLVKAHPIEIYITSIRPQNARSPSPPPRM